MRGYPLAEQRNTDNHFSFPLFFEMKRFAPEALKTFSRAVLPLAARPFTCCKASGVPSAGKKLANFEEFRIYADFKKKWKREGTGLTGRRCFKQ
jgi:hypothetical protein